MADSQLESQSGQQPIGVDAGSIIRAAQVVARSASVETMTRPFLDVLHGLTGLESTYLTEVRSEADEQTILFANNQGSIDIPEGLTVEWQDTLCRRALQSGRRCTSDVEADLPGSDAARQLGLKTYVSVPVMSSDDGLMGTLCGASGQAVEVPAQVLDVMQMLARLIADQWERDRAHAAALERAAHAEERLRARAVFLAEAEHKLKTPLTVLQGWSDMLAENWQEFDPDMRMQALETMQRASRDAARQVDQLLVEARGEVLSNQLQVAPLDLAPVIEEVVRQLCGVAGSTGHSVGSATNVAVQVRADREALWQVLWHLAENALKYSPNGGHIDVSSSEDGEGRVIVSVSDEGIGVPVDVDIFAPFTRGDSEVIAGIAGTGLGLHIVRNLAQAMGGSVSAAPREPGGSTFIVTFVRV